MKKLYNKILSLFLILIANSCIAMQSFSTPSQNTCLTCNAIITEPYTPNPNSNELIDLLLVNPQAVTKYNRKGRTKLIKSLSKIWELTPSETITRLETSYAKVGLLHQFVISEIEQKYPLLYLEECDSSNGGKKCFFNRQLYPERRELCAQIIARKLISKIHQKGFAICTSFGSGKKLHDTTILSHVLASCPSAIIQWESIDLLNQPGTKSKFGVMPYIVHEQDSFLKKTFPNATIILTHYPSVTEYIDKVDVANFSPTDLIYAIDLSDSNSIKNKTYACYRQLCAHTLLSNHKSENILFLTKDMNKPTEVAAHSYTFKQTKHSVTYKVELAGDTQNIYGATTIMKLPKSVQSSRL